MESLFVRTYHQVYNLVSYYFCAMSFVTFVSGSDCESVWGLIRSKVDLWWRPEDSG